MIRALLALGAAWLLLAATGDGVTESPHGRADGCPACHEPGADPATPGAPRPAIATCRGCHPTADMHPVGMLPKQVQVPPDFPLEAGAVVCSTCHAEPGCDEARPKEPPFLRGGPAARPSAFCVRCHDATGLQRANPHRTGAEGDAACTACHSGEPPQGAAPADARLRAGPDKACGECHPPLPHAGTAEHMGVAVPAEVAAALPPQIALADGRIACWTCHDVHDGGASAAAARTRNTTAALRALARGDRPEPARGAHPALLALPTEGDALCRACHGDGGR